MSQWGSSDSGILRKNRVEENFDQLLVFGYSCKVFREDEKALYIDQGKHLIPWMGDESLKIDRYDGRGALSDLKKFEASREGYDTLRWLGLSESEKKLEELCDSERYYSLEINEEEEEMYKEEAAKRLKTNAIAFNYNNPEPVEPVQPEGIPTVPEKEEEDEPYKPSPVLDVPIDINMPKTVKEYARIEKTALFVCRQGPQMEILIKAKQADNPQFSFLVVQDPLYKFYRHVLSAFKNGRYQPQCDKKPDEPQPADSQDTDNDSHYLHPSLQSAAGKPVTPPPTQIQPTVPYRPSADCAYSQLVNRIQGANGQSETQQQTVSQNAVPTQMQIISQLNLEQQYHQYYYVQQFYEYWRHTVVNSDQGAMYAGLPLNFNQLDPNMQSYIHQLAWAQFVQHHQTQIEEAQRAQTQAAANANNNSYAQIVSNLNKEVNPYTANVPQLPPPDPVQEPKTEEKPNEVRTVTLVKYDNNQVKKTLLSLAAAYQSGSESESESSESDNNATISNTEQKEPEEKIEVYRVPSGETQTVIDKMAEYVSKNGDQFEEIIRQKGDPRFDFLKEGHEFYKYYRAKVRDLKGEPEVKHVQVKAQKPAKVKAKKVIAPVSFSIKKPKDEPQKEIKSALPMEDSSEEENYIENAPQSPSKTTTNNNLAQKMPAVYNVPQVEQVSQINSEDAVTNLIDNEEKKAIVDNSKPREKTKSPKKRSRSSSPRKSHSPKKRSRTPSRSPVAPKRAKSRSKTPSNKSPIRIKDSPPKTATVSAIGKRSKEPTKKKAPAIDMFDVEEEKPKQNGIAKETDDPILEMMELEREAKAAEDEADEKEKARQLERKRKAAMFLKLKQTENKPAVVKKKEKSSERSSRAKSRKTPPRKSEKSSRLSPKVESSKGSRRNSADSIVTIRSRSTTREKSKPREKRDRSRSKGSTRSSRRSRSRERRRDKKHKKNKDRDRSRSKARDDEDRRRRREKKKKSHKRKHSKSKKKSKKHKRSRSSSRSSQGRQKSRSSSVKSHISIDSS